MPFFRFTCRACGYEKERLMDAARARAHQEPCPECGSTASLAASAPNAIAKETKDEYRGKSVEMDISEKLERRAREHFEKHDLPRLIEKEGKEFAIRQGFLDPDKEPK
jgi:putative FmdB family regulatory protein